MIRGGLLAAAGAAAVILAPVPAQAHRLDEYLQATRVAIARDRVDLEIDLTPGATIAASIAAEIDTDQDGRFSPAEGEAYARAALASITLSADGRPLAVTLDDRNLPDRAAMLEGLGTIRLRASAPMPRASGDDHTVEYVNSFRRASSVYLANTMVPADPALTIRSQARDPLQQRLTVTYAVASSRTRRAGAIGASLAVLLIAIGARRRARR